MANGAPLGDPVTCADEVIALNLRRTATRFHCLWSSLNDVELAGDAIFRPLHIHRATVVLFDGQRLPRQFFDVVVVDRKTLTQLRGRLLDPYPLTGLIGVHHALLLGTDLATQDCRFALLQGLFVNVEFIRIDRALHDHLAETVTGRNEDDIAETGFGVQSEQHAGGADVRAHHQLHAGRKEHVLVLETMMHAIGDGAVVVETGEHLLDLVHDVVGTDHVEKGLLLSCKRGVW
ncbi:MAG: hypothetical protein BWZ07_02042 [Alphaproteobacteria bacterium ADurb.BinA280]|nr:MAG: hypothetical protein BWZ07_02042 [Alphaproteobacteria bacterium ADurb.BinA280]